MYSKDECDTYMMELACVFPRMLHFMPQMHTIVITELPFKWEELKMSHAIYYG